MEKRINDKEMRAKIASLFEGVEPYTPDKAPTMHTIKLEVDGIGWVEVETRTPFVSCGMLEEAAEKILSGDYRKIEKPEGKTVSLKPKT